jgi:GNAT superfamily N-acetyltransferase
MDFRCRPIEREGSRSERPESQEAPTMTAPTYRSATDDDIAETYAVIRRSLFDYLFRQHLVGEATARSPPIEAVWNRQGRQIHHLRATEAQNWVACDERGTIVGWALGVDREWAAELTHFFVAPDMQARGIGRRLVERALPRGRSRNRSIIATQDAAGLSLSLRAGVGYQTMAVDFVAWTTVLEPVADRAFERLGTDTASVDAVLAIEAAVLGFRREPDVGFLLGMRPAWLARRRAALRPSASPSLRSRFCRSSTTATARSPARSPRSTRLTCRRWSITLSARPRPRRSTRSTCRRRCASGSRCST